MDEPLSEPGWYNDPANSGTHLRYWDGNAWAEYVMPQQSYENEDVPPVDEAMKNAGEDEHNIVFFRAYKTHIYNYCALGVTLLNVIILYLFFFPMISEASNIFYLGVIMTASVPLFSRLGRSVTEINKKVRKIGILGLYVNYAVIFTYICVFVPWIFNKSNFL